MTIGKAIAVLVVLALMLPLTLACPEPEVVDPQIKVPVEFVPIGVISDMTGATSDVGKDNALGVREAVEFFNSPEGGDGIGGIPIRLHQFDYGYRVPEALTLYARFRDVYEVLFVKGWGTPDTEALSPTINHDRMPFTSGSWSAHLTDPAKTPFNFVYGSTDYSTQARGLLQWHYDQIWRNHPEYGLRAPRFAAVGHVGHPFPTAPLAALRDHARLLGYEQMSEDPDTHCQHVSLFALDAKSQVLDMKAWGPPDVIWFGNTGMSNATLARELFVAGLLYPKGPTVLMGNNYSMCENFVRIAGAEIAEGVFCSSGTAFWVEDFPWRDKVHYWGAKINPGVPFEMRSRNAVAGWAAVNLIVTALRRVEAAGKLCMVDVAATRVAVRDAVRYEPIDMSGLGWPAPFLVTSTDHRPSSHVIIGQVVDGAPRTVGTIDMKALWPDLWDDWLGW